MLTIYRSPAYSNKEACSGVALREFDGRVQNDSTLCWGKVNHAFSTFVISIVGVACGYLNISVLLVSDPECCHFTGFAFHLDSAPRCDHQVWSLLSKESS